MAYTVDVLYTKNEDFSNPTTVTESGQPTDMELTGLDANEVYYVKAVLKNDGVTEDESEVEDFQTLQAGTITLTHQSSVRSGSNYVVTYTYTSTYALSSSVLRCGASVSSQGVISGNTITFTVSGLVPGDAYLSQITTIDIYGESAQTTITLIMPVVNQVSITSTTATDTTVECELDYTIDGGFTQGWVEYWDEGDDPSTDQAQGHNTFIDGETSCTIAGLTDGTTYQFRATIYYGGYVNYVTSNVITATTKTQYDSKYFTIKNTGSNRAYVYLYRVQGQGTVDDVYVSTNNGTSWSSYSSSYSSPGTLMATLETGNSMLLKHTGNMEVIDANGGANTRINIKTYNSNLTTKIELSGNIASLCFGDDFNSSQTMPFRAYSNLFKDAFTNITEVSASKVSFGSFSAISEEGTLGLFYGCSGLVSAPNLSTITSVNDYGMKEMFRGCSALTTPPVLSNITSIGDYALEYTFRDCSSLTTGPDLSGITAVSDFGLHATFMGCTALTTPPDLSSVTRNGNRGMYQLFSNCSHLTTPPDISGITTTNALGFDEMFSGCTRLATAPDLSNLTYVSYSGMRNMFYFCSSLTTPPDLSNITVVESEGMHYMFANCNGLTTAPDLSSVVGYSGSYNFAEMFYGCTSMTTPPDLSSLPGINPSSCYRMFINCTALTAGPDITGVRSVSSNGMQEMFRGCSLLATAYAPTVSGWTGASNWLSGVAASGTIYVTTEELLDTIVADSDSGCPTGWTKQLIS